MAYQSFDSSKGDSNSSAKLAKIQLPADLTGKTVLDIGCNEGYFCNQAIERGAARVVGIDENSGLLEVARSRTPKAEFIADSWWKIPPERFDLILFLSAIHYEAEPKKLLTLISTRLKKSGLLILECGVIEDMFNKYWAPVQRFNGVLRYPTARLMLEDLLSDYAVRDVGPSVLQPGDPVPRRVFHCTLWQPTILVVSGKSGTGKTNLARQFSQQGFNVLFTDFLLNLLRNNPHKLQSPFISFLAKHPPGSVETLIREAIADGVIDDYCLTLLRFISREHRLTIVEGYAFSLPEVRELFKKHAVAGGYKVIYTLL